MLKINEIFGPTVQGEGTAAGRHCLFVRVALCNLECLWCDTDYTWAFTKEKAAKHRNNKIHARSENLFELSAQQVIDRLRALWNFYDMPTIIVVSGGEPMMQQDELMPLLWELTAAGCEIHIETAGTIGPRYDTISFTALSGETIVASFDALVTQYNVSPKLTNSGNVLGKRYKPIVLKLFAKNPKARFKFVVTHNRDLDEIDEMVLNQGIVRGRVMVMPEGTTPDLLMLTGRNIADEAIARGFGVSLRSHVLLWPKVHRGK